MTTIKLATNDQALVAMEQITLASGDVNSVEIHVMFDAAWDGYGKSAVFFSSNDKTPFEVTLSGDRCVVPPEVLEKTGQLYIGIRGVTYDKVKTSALIKYKIVEGAPRGEGIPVEPASDVYQQLLAAYGDLTARDGKAAVIRVKDTNGGRDVTFWVGTSEEYDALEHEQLNCIYIITDDNTAANIANTLGQHTAQLAALNKIVTEPQVVDVTNSLYLSSGALHETMEYEHTALWFRHFPALKTIAFGLRLKLQGTMCKGEQFSLYVVEPVGQNKFISVKNGTAAITSLSYFKAAPLPFTVLCQPRGRDGIAAGIDMSIDFYAQEDIDLSSEPTYLDVTGWFFVE